MPSKPPPGRGLHAVAGELPPAPLDRRALAELQVLVVRAKEVERDLRHRLAVVLRPVAEEAPVERVHLLHRLGGANEHRVAGVGLGDVVLPLELRARRPGGVLQVVAADPLLRDVGEQVLRLGRFGEARVRRRRDALDGVGDIGPVGRERERLPIDADRRVRTPSLLVLLREREQSLEERACRDRGRPCRSGRRRRGARAPPSPRRAEPSARRASASSRWSAYPSSSASFAAAAQRARRSQALGLFASRSSARSDLGPGLVDPAVGQRALARDQRGPERRRVVGGRPAARGGRRAEREARGRRPRTAVGRSGPRQSAMRG